MENSIDLSVIVPCKNLEKEISVLINSLIIQKIENYKIELIFVCDSCTDLTHSIILSRADDLRLAGYKSIIVFENDNNSCGYARNNGLLLSRGKYIYFCDGDDWLIDDSVFVEILNKFYETNSDVISFNWKSDTYKYKNEKSMVWQYCYSRKIVGATRFKAENYKEDYYFNLEINSKNPIMNHINKEFYYYNYGRDGSNCMNYKKKV